MKTVITAGARGADIDVFACAVAYAELLELRGKKAQAVIVGDFTMSVTPSILKWGANFEKDYQRDEEDEFVLVDMSDPEHLPGFVGIERVGEVYDHRHGYEDFWVEKLGNNSHIEMVGACGTLIWEQFNEEERKQITLVSAKLLLASIVSNTLNFQAPITTERDKTAYEELKNITGLDDTWVADYFREQEELLMSDFKTFLRTDTKIFKIPAGDFVIGQIELWDAEEVISSKISEINEVMDSFGAFPWILNAPNISKGFNFIYSSNTKAKEIIEDKLGVRFDDNIAKTPKLVMRKQIMKVLRDVS